MTAVTTSPLADAADLLRKAHPDGCVHQDAVAVLRFQFKTADPGDVEVLRAAATVIEHTATTPCTAVA